MMGLDQVSVFISFFFLFSGFLSDIDFIYKSVFLLCTDLVLLVWFFVRCNSTSLDEDY